MNDQSTQSETLFCPGFKAAVGLFTHHKTLTTTPCHLFVQHNKMVFVREMCYCGLKDTVQKVDSPIKEFWSI